MAETESTDPKQSSSEQDNGSPSESQVVERGANPPPRPGPVSEVPDPPPPPNPNVPVQRAADLTARSLVLTLQLNRASPLLLLVKTRASDCYPSAANSSSFEDPLDPENIQKALSLVMGVFENGIPMLPDIARPVSGCTNCLTLGLRTRVESLSEPATILLHRALNLTSLGSWFFGH